jgi:DNA repair protein RecN (Recombination protein N)
MLIKLSVQNYALIKDLDFEPGEGLTIITGETGAGKSILLGALSLILGSRTDTSVLLNKNEKCIVEGTFKTGSYDLDEFFAVNELDSEPVTILRREINPAGKSRAFINDTPVNLNVLRELGDRLIDIHSQHQTLMLNNSNFQLDVIDSFAGNQKLKATYRKIYSNYRKLKKEYDDAKGKSDQNKADFDYYSFQLSQLDEAALTENEQAELEQEQDLLTHAGEVLNSLGNVSSLLNSEGVSVLSSLREIRNLLARIKAYLPPADELHNRIESALIELSDIAAESDKLLGRVDADPGRLEKVNSRLDALYSLCQKHRVSSVPELILKREEIRSKLRNVITGDERITELEKLLSKETELLRDCSAGMSAARIKAIPEAEKNISEMLRQLGMPNAKFRIVLKQTSEFTQSGIDQADFLFSANKQIEPENLSRIASGGELSRVMLCLKSHLTRNSNLPTIIFDEIDSGVSGEVADKVGQILAAMGKYMQVVNITHLPQVASRGSKHFHVYKDDTGDATITRVRLLSFDERITELARLLSGSEITDTAVKNARELLKAGQINN